MKPAAIPMSKDGEPPGKGLSTSSNEAAIRDDTSKDKSYQSEGIMDSFLL